MPRVELNKKAPDFTLTGIGGDVVKLSEFYGKSNILLVFNRGFT
jgi:peroxiredoxin